MRFSGSLVAIVTPMHPDGSLDLPALRKLLDWHIESGTSGIVIVGTTGESPTVDVDEHCTLIKTTVDHVAKRIQVVAGTGANSTSEAIELTRFAKEVGADACLSVSPYYNKPTQEGLYRHFRAIVESVDLPLIVYNVPGRTVSDVSADTLLRLAEVPGIVGVKDATSDLVRHVDMMRRMPKAESGRAFSFLSGNDDTALAYILLGGDGVISVTANVAPKGMADMCRAARDGNLESARAINNQLMPLHVRLFVEANPIPVKWALAQMGRIDAGIRLPMTPLDEKFHDTVRAALRESGCQ
jgi:4-hydroxy-tetrahydrodipicolinate synthase